MKKKLYAHDKYHHIVEYITQIIDSKCNNWPIPFIEAPHNVQINCSLILTIFPFHDVAGHHCTQFMILLPIIIIN